MHDLDDDGLISLVAGTVKQAERDAKNGDADASSFLAWIRNETEAQAARFADFDRRLDALHNGHTATPATKPKAEPATPSPFEGIDARALDAMGVSTAWAGMTAEQIAELDRKQAHRDRAARMGVDWRFLPEED